MKMINNNNDVDKNQQILLEQAYQLCLKYARSHYENFPVASILLPKRLRKPIAVIYSFARLADDIADEGNLSSEIRLQKLNALSEGLHKLTKHQIILESLPSQFEDVVLFALKDVINNFNLSVSLLLDLLTAFKQDIIKNEYENLNEILHYCRYSANPVGRLLLQLNNNATEENCLASDKICTALQLINFLQDIYTDLTERNRCYLPKDERLTYQVSLDHIYHRKDSIQMHQLIDKQLEFSEKLLIEGSTLCKQLTGLFGMEIRLIVAGGMHIVKQLKRRKSVYVKPKIKYWHFPILLWYTL